MEYSAQTEREAEHSRAVREMFAGIARRYDLLNHLLSLNIDKRWRRRVRSVLSDILRRPDARILDVACGTGDLSIELKLGAEADVIASDFCRPMLALAKSKPSAKEIRFVEADAMHLPFEDGFFDAVTIAFGLRNLPNIETGLGELNRILNSTGKLVVLEFSSPIVPGFKHLFNFYFGSVLPRIGGLISGSRSAYTYLPESVSKFPDQKALARLLGLAGFNDVKYENLTGGIAAIHIGTKA